MSEKTIRCKILQDLPCPAGYFRKGSEADVPAHMVPLWTEQGVVKPLKSSKVETAEAKDDAETAEAPDPEEKPAKKATKKKTSKKKATKKASGK